MSVLIFILILSFLVIIHELGHFLMARRVGVKVEEFGIGYPPRAVTLATDKRGTAYTLNWLPFGGFVRLYGEDGEAAAEPGKQQGAFFTKSVPARLLVIVMGAMVNFLFGVVAFGAMYTYLGVPTHYDYVTVEAVAPGSPAESAGIKPDDAFQAVRVDGRETAIKSVDDFVEQVSQFKGKTVELVRQGTGEGVVVTVRTAEQTPEGEGAMGVVVTDFAFVHYPIWQMPFRGMVYGLRTAVEFGGILLKALEDMVANAFRGVVPQDVAGPVGIGYIVQREGILSGGLLPIINFAAILSINLAIVNLLPIPALDGGRAFFIFLEGLTGKRVKPQVERSINTVGFAALVILLILISVKDLRMVAADPAIQQWFQRLF